MAEVYEVKITNQAQSQLREIFQYIASDLQAPETALQLLNTLENAIASLSHMPKRIALTEEAPWHHHGIRRMTVKSYLVYFWIDEKALKVQVTAVIYGRRDQEQQLTKMDLPFGKI